MAAARGAHPRLGSVAGSDIQHRVEALPSGRSKVAGPLAVARDAQAQPG